MKERVSATIDDGISKKIDRLVRDRKYRNKSHFIEDAILDKLEKEGVK